MRTAQATKELLAARDDEHVPVAEPRAELRQVDALGEDAALVTQELERVLREGLQRACDARTLLVQRALEVVLAERAPLRKARAVPVEACAAHREQLTVGHLLEQVGSGRVDQPHPAPHELERSRVREAAGLALCDVHHDAHARLDELLGGDTVEVGVVDDRHVVRPEPLGEVLRAPVQPRVAVELDEAHTAGV